MENRIIKNIESSVCKVFQPFIHISSFWNRKNIHSSACDLSGMFPHVWHKYSLAQVQIQDLIRLMFLLGSSMSWLPWRTHMLILVPLKYQRCKTPTVSRHSGIKLSSSHNKLFVLLISKKIIVIPMNLFSTIEPYNMFFEMG